MAYLSTEWEAAQLKKQSESLLRKEIEFLRLSLIQKRFLLKKHFDLIVEGDAIMLPLWMIESDIKNLFEQLERVVAEIKRRELP